MKIRDSGMPDEGVWERFFDARSILSQLAIPGCGADVVDFGCGYGTFSVAAARLGAGVVYALDIEPEMVRATAEKARVFGLVGVRAAQRDFVSDGTGLPACTVDYAMLFNILHAIDPLALLAEAHRVLRPEGRVAVVHWIPDASTPRGPDLGIRPRPEQCQTWIRAAGFELLLPLIALPPYHFGVVGRKA